MHDYICAGPNSLEIRLDFSSRYPRKLKITNFWRQFWPKICVRAPKFVVPDQQDNRYHQLHCPIRPPSRRDMAKKRLIPIHGTRSSDENKWHYCDAPLNFCEFRSEILTSYVLSIWTACANKRTACPLFNTRSIFLQTKVKVTSFGIFLDCCIGHTSRTQKKGGAGFSFVGWCMVKTPCVVLKKSHPNHTCVNWAGI